MMVSIPTARNPSRWKSRCAASRIRRRADGARVAIIRFDMIPTGLYLSNPSLDRPVSLEGLGMSASPGEMFKIKRMR
jgi:hypothetical protein